VERDLGLICYPVTWPITSGMQFLGVYHRLRKQILLFDRGEDHGQRRSTVRVSDLADDSIRELLGEAAHDQLQEEVELLDMAGAELTEDMFLTGAVSPTY